MADHIRDHVHVNVRHSAALDAADMVVVERLMVKTVGFAGHFYFPDFMIPGKNVQVPVYRSSADGRSLRFDELINFIGSGMISQLRYGMENEIFLYGVSVLHGRSCY